MRAMWTSLVAGLAVAGACAEAQAQLFCPNSATNMRLLTANVHCLGALDGENNEDLYDMDLETRMLRVADIIAKEGADVVAIQDAFHDPCRDALVKRLAEGAGTYPYYVHTLGHPTAHQDSGMMLFSKHPFQPFPPPGAPAGAPWSKNDAVHVRGRHHGVAFEEDHDYVVWYLFEGIDDELLGWDRFASKMVAMVRVQPPSGCAANVAFTHFQADGKGDLDHALAMEKRQRELEGARRLVTRNLGSNALRMEPLFLLGDLNIDGNQSPPNVAGHSYRYKVLDDDGDVVVTAYGEWDEVFEPTHVSHPDDGFENLFFRCGLDGFAASGAASCQYNPAAGAERLFTDTWGFEMPRSDWGQTSGAPGQHAADNVFRLEDPGGERLDYILHNQPGDGVSYLCAQRMERVFFFDPNGPAQHYLPAQYRSSQTGEERPFADNKVVSDHFFVVGDFLFSRAPRCSPVLASTWNARGPAFGAERVTFAGSPDAAYSVALGSATSGNRRQYAWFVLNQRGTVSVGTWPSGRGRVEIYHHSDLSTPVSSYHGLTNTWRATTRPAGIFTGPTYDLPDPPYHVRFSIDPFYSGALPATFWAGFHLHRCSSATNDVCVLSPGIEHAVKWPGGQHLLPYQSTAPPAYPDAMYFLAFVDRADSGRDPAVDFTIEVANEKQLPVASWARLFGRCGFDQRRGDCPLFACNRPAVTATYTSWTPDSDGDGLKEITMRTGNEVSGVLAPTVPGTPKPYVLRVRRRCAPAVSCTAQPMRVTYRGALQTLTPLALTCLDEEDPGFNDDEVFFHLALDGPGPGPASCGALFGYTSLDRFDEHNESNKSHASLPAYGFGPRTFTSSVVATACESDGSVDDNDFLGEGLFAASPLQGQVDAIHHMDFSANPDARYTFKFGVKRERNSRPAQTCP